MDGIAFSFRRESAGRPEGVHIGQPYQNQQRLPSQPIYSDDFQQGGPAVGQEQQPHSPQQSAAQQDGLFLQPPPPDPLLLLSNANEALVSHVVSLRTQNARFKQEVHQLTTDCKTWDTYCHSLWDEAKTARVKAQEQHSQQIRDLKEQHRDSIRDLEHEHAVEFFNQTCSANDARTGLCLTIRKTQKDRDDLRVALDIEKGANNTAVAELLSQFQALEVALAEEQTANHNLQDKIEKQQAEAQAQYKTASVFALKYVREIAALRNQVKELGTKFQDASSLSEGQSMEITRLEGELRVAVEAVNDLARKDEAAQAKITDLQTNVDQLRVEIKQEQKNNGILSAALSCETSSRLAAASLLKEVEAKLDEEKSALTLSDWKRHQEQKQSKLGGDIVKLKGKKRQLEVIVNQQKTTLCSNSGELLKNGNETSDLTKQFNTSRKTAKEDEENSARLHEDKIEVGKEKGKSAREKAVLEAQLQETEQDLENGIVAKKVAQEERHYTQGRLTEFMRCDSMEREGRESKKRLFEHDGCGDDSPAKKFRPSTEMTPPKSPKSPKNLVAPPTTAPIQPLLEDREPSLAPRPTKAASRGATPKGLRYPERYHGRL